METAYEAIFIVDTAQPEEQVTGIVDKYTGVVTRAGGLIDDIDRMEPRRLAYEIKGRREGLYVLLNFRSEPPARDELDRIFRISDDVLRHMIIKQDQKADRFPSKARQAEQERRERDMAARQAAAPPPSAPAAPEPVTELAGDSGASALAAPAAPQPEQTVAETTTTLAVDNPDAADAPRVESTGNETVEPTPLPGQEAEAAADSATEETSGTPA